MATNLNNLRFDALRFANINRKAEAVFSSHDWDLSKWACAMAGEAGEACNIVKKMFRGDYYGNNHLEYEATIELSKELADMIIYADLLAQKAGIDLGQAIVNKFNEVSDKKGAITRL